MANCADSTVRMQVKLFIVTKSAVPLSNLPMRDSITKGESVHTKRFVRDIFSGSINQQLPLFVLVFPCHSLKDYPRSKEVLGFVVYRDFDDKPQ